MKIVSYLPLAIHRAPIKDSYKSDCAGWFETLIGAHANRVIYTFLLVGIGKVPYKPDAGPAETLAFKHYNPTQVCRKAVIIIAFPCCEICGWVNTILHSSTMGESFQDYSLIQDFEADFQ